MNRRSFFKMITGFATGVFAAFAPQTKGLTKTEQEKVLGIDVLQEYEAKKRSGTLSMWTPGTCDFYAPINGVCKCKHKNGKWVCIDKSGCCNNPTWICSVYDDDEPYIYTLEVGEPIT